MSSTIPSAGTSARTYESSRQQKTWRSILLSVELLVLGAAGWIATWDDSHALMNGGFLAALMLFLIGVTVPPMFVRIDTAPWSLEYCSLISRKHVEIRDVWHLSVEFFKGSRVLTIKTDHVVISITDQTVPKQALEELAEFIYAGADATGNVRLKRPIAQKKFADFAKSK